MAYPKGHYALLGEDSGNIHTIPLESAQHTVLNHANSTGQHTSDHMYPSQRCDVISVEESLHYRHAHQQLKKALEDHIWKSTGTLLES